MLARSMAFLTLMTGVHMSDGYVAHYSSHAGTHSQPAQAMLSAELTHPCRGTVVCTVIGEIDMVTVPILDEALRAAAHIGPDHLIVDLSGVTFLGSHGLHALVDAHDTQHRTPELYIVANTVAVTRPLNVIGLTDVLTLFSDLDTALKAYAVLSE
jgi:anti-sigma B factor antagonist